MSKSVSLNRDDTDLLASLIIEEPDHYAVLGVTRDAPLETINAAYSIAIEHFHPLKRTDLIEGDGIMRYRLSQAFLRLEEAYVTLSSPARRKVYDNKLGSRPSISMPLTEWSAAALLQEENATQNRRRVERLQMRLPALVTFGNRWQEVTETRDVSPLGIRLGLSRHVEPGTLLRVELPMPQPLRTHSYGEEHYSTKAYVIYTLKQERENLVVMELI